MRDDTKTTQAVTTSVPPLTDYYKSQLLNACFHYMPSHIRDQIMRDCPQAYNAYYQREILKVLKPA